MSDVFLSYASADADRAAAIADLLGQRGFSVWWDRTIPPGRVFDEVIQEAIDASACVVVLWTRTSVTSNWVKTEAAEGAKRHVLVPVAIDRAKIPMEFRRIQAANLQDWAGDPAHPEFERLVQSIGRLSRGAGDAGHPVLERSAPGGVNRRRWRLLPRTAVTAALLVAAAAGLALAARTFVLSRDRSPTPADASTSATTAAGPNATSSNGAARGPLASAGRSGALRVNLLAARNGGALVTASSDSWAGTIDGIEEAVAVVFGEATFAFRDERPALVDTFAVLITDTADGNLREFELLSGNDSPSGRFDAIGTFQTQNIKLFKTPYQEFTFAPRRAKYLKVRLLSNYLSTKFTFAREFQLWGTPE